MLITVQVVNILYFPVWRCCNVINVSICVRPEYRAENDRTCIWICRIFTYTCSGVDPWCVGGAIIILKLYLQIWSYCSAYGFLALPQRLSPHFGSVHQYAVFQSRVFLLGYLPAMLWQRHTLLYIWSVTIYPFKNSWHTMSQVEVLDITPLTMPHEVAMKARSLKCVLK